MTHASTSVRRGWAALALVVGLGLIPAAHAQVIVREGPPRPRIERIPPPRAGYVWDQGHYAWSPRIRAYVWVPGTWIVARPGWRRHPGEWERRRDGWVYREGRWGR